MPLMRYASSKVKPNHLLENPRSKKEITHQKNGDFLLRYQECFLFWCAFINFLENCYFTMEHSLKISK